MPQTETLTLILEKLEKIEKWIVGNGKPESGLLIRVDRLEGKAKRATWIISTLFGALAMAGFEFVFTLLRK